MALATVGVRLTADNLGAFRNQMRQAGSSINEFGASAKRVQTQTRGITGSLAGAGAGLAGALGPVAGVTLGLAGAGAALKSVVSTGADFEQAMSNVGAISRATADEQRQLTQASLDLGATTAFSATQVADGQKFLAQAGFEVNETLQAMPGLLSVASAAQTDLGTTSDLTSNILGQFNLEASETGKLGNTLTSVFTGANTDLVQLGTALSFGGASFGALGGSVEEAAVAVGLFSDAGVQASRAGTGLRAIGASLAAPTAEAAKEMARLGVDAFDTEGNFIGLANVVDNLNASLSGLSDQQRVQSIDTIFGRVATPAALALLDAGGDEIRKRLADVDTAQQEGLSDLVAAEQLDNLRGDITLLSSAWEGLSITLSGAVNPALRTITQGLTGTIQATNSFITGIQSGQGVLASFSTSFASLTPNLSAVATGLDSALATISAGLSQINLPEIDFSQVFANYDTSGITLPTLSGTLDFLVTNINTLFGTELSTSDFALPTLSGAVDFVVNAINAVLPETITIPALPAVDTLFDDINNLVPSDFTLPTLPDISTLLNDITNLVPTGFTLPTLPDLSTITTALSSIDLSFGGLSTTIDTFDTSLSSLSDGGLSTITGIITDTIGGISTALEGVDIGTAGQTFSDIIASTLGVVETLNGLGTETSTAAVESLNGLAIGVANFATNLTESIDADLLGTAATGVITSFVDRFTATASSVDLPGISEAATAFYATYTQKLGEFASGDNIAGIAESVGGFASTIVSQIGSTLASPEVGENVGLAVGNVADTILQAITSTFSGLSETLAETDTDALVAGTVAIAKNIVTAITTAFGQIDFGALLTDIEDYGENVATFVTNLGGSITSAISGSNLTFDSLKDSITTAFDSLKESIRIAIDGLLVGAAEFLPGASGLPAVQDAQGRLDQAAAEQQAVEVKASFVLSADARAQLLGDMGEVDIPATVTVVDGVATTIQGVIDGQPYTVDIASFNTPTISGEQLVVSGSPSVGMNYVTLTQEQAENGQASVYYTLGGQAGPKDKTARVTYVTNILSDVQNAAGTTLANASGTPNFPGGTTSIAELGPELALLPNGQALLFSGRQLANLPPHTQILPADITRQVQRGQQVSSPTFRGANRIETQNAIQQSIINSTTNNAGSNTTSNTNHYNLSVSAQQSSGNIEDDFEHMIARSGGY